MWCHIDNSSFLEDGITTIYKMDLFFFYILPKVNDRAHKLSRKVFTELKSSSIGSLCATTALAIWSLSVTVHVEATSVMASFFQPGSCICVLYCRENI